MATIWKILTRKKVIDPVQEEESSLARVLNTFDLTALGVGSTLGVGVYVLAGHVAKETAGPAVVFSFLIAAVASVFAGLCYAEFGARVPRAGSAYIYSYVCVGEFVAFVIGWNLILEYVIGSASVARGMSSYLDTLVNDTMQKTFAEITPINIPYFSQYFDFFSFGVSVVLAVALAFGLKESSLVNNIFTTLNVGVVLFVVIAGSIEADFANWSVPGNSTDPAIGNGGFLPFGIEGVIKGAATCFYGFVGFDCIATTGEEVKNPKKAIPISIILSLFIIFLAYFGTSTVITLMVPYYRQDSEAPIPFAFEDVGWYWAKWVVSIGGIFGLCASLFGAMFPLPRVIYAMANDSLVFKFLGKVHPRFQTPVVGTILAGVLTGLMAALFELSQLVNMMSIGTLLAYTIVAASVLLLRYAADEPRKYLPLQTSSDSDDSDTYTDTKTADGIPSQEDSTLLKDETDVSVIGQIFNCGRLSNPTKTSETIVAVEVFLYCITCVVIGLCAIYLKDKISEGEIWAIVLTSLAVFLAVMLVMSLVTQPTSKKELSFKVPMVPLIPALSIMTNVYLMLMLDVHTWIRFGVWMIIGLPVYYFSVRIYTDAQNPTVSLKATDTHKATNGKSNGHVNHYVNYGFDYAIEKNLNGTKRMEDIPQSPNTEDKIHNLLLEKELQKLDRMLDEEVEKLSSNFVDRKLSIDTVSVASSVVNHEESVVAVVHRDNVATPAETQTPSLFLQVPLTTKLTESNNIAIERRKEEETKLKKPVTNPATTNQVADTNNSDDKKEHSSFNMDAILTEGDIIEAQKNEQINSIAESFVHNSETDSNTAVENHAPAIWHPEFPEAGTNAPKQNETSEDIIMHVSPTNTPPSSPITENQTAGSNPPPPPPPPLPVLTVNMSTLVRPTSENLTSVTLRKVQARLDAKDHSDFQPEEDNLRVKSEKTKKFMESLNDKLNRMTVIPTYIPPVVYQKKFEAAKPITRANSVNENVIQEAIDPKEAKAKLDAFLNTRIETSQNNSDDTKDTEENVDEDIESKVNDTDNPHDITKDNDIKEIQENTIAHDYEKHKNRMRTVFRSMNLKDLGSVMPEQSRIVNTIGPVSDDKTKHRQAMNDIFNSIKLRRKDSRRLSN